MKSLVNHINESNEIQISEAQITTDINVVLPILEKNLSKLSDLIKKHLGFAPKLYAIRSGDVIRIESDDLIKEIGKLGKAMFKDIKISTWGGKIMTGEENMLWINPKLEYHHVGGGSNGTDFLWDSLYFDFANEKFIEGRKLS